MKTTKAAKAAYKKTLPQGEPSSKDQLYVEMVKAVRRWIAAEYPFPIKDRVDIALFNALGCGETIACFHISAADEYTLGDLRAMGDRG